MSAQHNDDMSKNPPSWAESGKSALTPELREWALQQFTEEEIIAGLEEVRTKGGVELHEFIKELEQAVEQQ